MMTLVVCGTYFEYQRLCGELGLDHRHSDVAWLGPDNILSGRFPPERTRVIFGFVPDNVDMSNTHSQLRMRGLML